jgi:hypothetical protein
MCVKIINTFEENGPKMDFGKKLGVKANMKPPMTIEEAQRILGFESVKDKDFVQVQDTFERLFSVNDPSKGGSFYIQSKVYRARECIESELLKEGILSREQFENYKKATDNLIQSLRQPQQQQQQQQQKPQQKS